MNKFVVVLGTLALALAASSAIADSLTTPVLSGSVSVGSRDSWRGQKMSNDANLGLDLKADNLFVKGLYVDGDFGKNNNDFPVNSYTVVESDVGLGYAFEPVDGLRVDASMHHIWNAQEYAVWRNGRWTAGDYSEFRLKASYNVLFAQVTQGVGPIRNEYAQVGVDVPVSLVSDKLHVGAAVSAYHYHGHSGNAYNNSEVFASYNVLKNLQVYGKYSFGGRAQPFDQAQTLETLPNYGLVGVSYSF